MPERSICDAFEEKYGEYVTVIRSKFFSETNNRSLIDLEKAFVNEVKKYNHSAAYGYFNMWLMKVFGPRFLSKIIMDTFIPGAKKAATEHMEEFKPDMVVSTHWSTNYYARHIPSQPLTVSYIPDIQIIPLCRYDSDMTLISAERGYQKALKKYKKRFNKDNLRLVPFAIRKEAFELSMDKKENRKLLGLDEDKFTIVMFEGGYGLGRMSSICKLLAQSDLNLTVIAICGKNKKLYNKLKTLKTNPGINLVAKGYCDNTLQYIAAADLFLGKSGASSVAEPTYFGVAEIITKYATSMEKDNAAYYIEDVKNAVRIFNPQKAVAKIREFIEHPEEIEKMQENALKYHGNYGSEKTADVLWEMLCKKYPELSAIDVETAEHRELRLKKERESRQPAEE
jgi:UDP-N-acetylglucosamine:LPS N-acetylglucosamine transferase